MKCHHFISTSFLVLGLSLPASSQIDLDGDGWSDLWQLRYNLSSLDGDLDPDGDGQSNAFEAVAGTDPLDGSAGLRTQATLSALVAGDVFQLDWDSIAGKQYAIQMTSDLESWQADGSAVIGDGGNETFTRPLFTGPMFYRLAVTDIDRDGDGLTDAEEALLGLNPALANSSFATTGLAAGGDLSYAVSLLTSGETFMLDGQPVSAPAPSTQEVTRFLTQAAMGASMSEVADLQNSTYEGWIEDQFTKGGGSQITPEIQELHLVDDSIVDNQRRAAWWRQFLTKDDMLRQRMALALSEIFVVSEEVSSQEGVADYHDLLLDGAFGNVRTLLQDITLHTAMGQYLSTLKNQKADPSINRFPDENYAREVMQLFTIGLFELNLDGSRKTDLNGDDIPTYDNDDIKNFARVFTGLSHGGPGRDPLRTGQFFFGNSTGKGPAWTDPMLMWEAFHDREQKELLNGLILPDFDDVAGRTGMDDITEALDSLFEHDNTAPFLSRLLIQRLVTSNPSPQYIKRVALAFENDGNNVRGNMKAIIKAILLDPEARQIPDEIGAGRLREPFVRHARMGRIFQAAAPAGFFRIKDRGDDLSQYWQAAPSVFNFFLPDHQPAGELAANGLNGPEFQIMNAVSAVSIHNFFRDGLTKGALDRDATLLYDWSFEESISGDARALVEHLNELIAAGQLSEQTITTITTAVATYSDDRRVEIALRLINIAPDYAVFR